MQIGVVFPQREIGSDLGGVRAYVDAIAELGFSHVVAYDHVLGADKTVHEDLPGPYDIHDAFHEPLVLFGWLSGISSLGMATGILIAPQRQTALLAKQAAQVDLLSGGGRLRLGLGLGWNPVEYAALGQSFTQRGARLDEQIELLRQLWTHERVTFEGRFDAVSAAGLAPLPPTRPIPIWLGAVAPAALRRVGRLADGWFPQARPGGTLDASLEIVRAAATEAGRDPSTIGMEGIMPATGSQARVAELAQRWRDAGASHLALDTMDGGLGSVDEHVEALRCAAETLGLGAPSA